MYEIKNLEAKTENIAELHEKISLYLESIKQSTFMKYLYQLGV